MIIEWLFNLIMTLVFGLFSILPTLPQMPEPITNGANYLINIFENAAGAVAYIFGNGFYQAVLVLTIFLFTFEYTYKIFIWIWRKLPWSSQ